MNHPPGQTSDRDPEAVTTVSKPSVVQTVVPGFCSSSGDITVVDDDPGHDSFHLIHEVAPQNREIPRYGERAEIGRGGMGRVYRVLDQDLNRAVAMKVLAPKHGKASGSLLRRFVAEAQISGQLEHPGLLPIHDIGIDAAGQAFFTMRYVAQHETLSDIIDRLRAGDPETHIHYTLKHRIQIIQRVCDALTYAHDRGVVHRDIKPSNILIGETGEIYLADWGVATLVDLKSPTAVRTTIVEKELEEGSLVGTPLYMSPEQLVGATEITPQSDVYNLCAVAYELLSLEHYLGTRPPADYLRILDVVLEEDRIDAEDHIHPQNGRVPRQLSRVLRKGLQKERNNAIRTADELSWALQRWVEGDAKVVCPGTFIQYCLERLRRAIDKRPTLLPALSIVLGLALVVCVGVTARVIVDALK